MDKKLTPITSDGNFTCGYDSDGRPGVWPGNMTDKPADFLGFMPASEDQEFETDDGHYMCVRNGDDLAWQSTEGEIILPD